MPLWTGGQVALGSISRITVHRTMSMNLLLDNLISEERNPASVDIDLLTTEQILSVINCEDQKVALAVAQEIPHIASAVDVVAESLRSCGRLIYVGAGTSGRLGVLDASECQPTFNVSPELIQGVLAGGMRATHKSVEASEDDERAGAAAMKRKRLSPKDVVAGIAASGRTPFTLGAMKYAKDIGAKVLSITCNPDSKMAAIADVSIAPLVGPEVITGSTRMKSGTAQKLVLNMISSTAMIKLGYVHSNLMIHVQMKNTKLRERGRRIVMAVSGVNYETADLILKRAKGNIKVAIVALELGLSPQVALKRLKKAQMNLRKALA
jgi:N-acetylmuramic acid 6-phosphate etherase